MLSQVLREPHRVIKEYQAAWQRGARHLAAIWPILERLQAVSAVAGGNLAQLRHQVEEASDSFERLALVATGNPAFLMLDWD